MVKKWIELLEKGYKEKELNLEDIKDFIGFHITKEICNEPIVTSKYKDTLPTSLGKDTHHNWE